MTPSVLVLASFVGHSIEVVADYIRLNVEVKLENQVSKASLKPHKELATPSLLKTLKLFKNKQSFCSFTCLIRKTVTNSQGLPLKHCLKEHTNFNVAEFVKKLFVCFWNNNNKISKQPKKIL